MVIRNALVHGLKAILRCINLLPYSAQQKFGSALGYLCYWGIPKRRRVAKSNISICLSDHTHKEQKQILKAHFKSLGKNLIAMYTVWFGNAAKIEKKMLITGEHYLTQALDQKKGVVLLSAHFTTLELPFCWLKRIGINTGAMYREQKNTSWNQVMHQGRSRHINHLFRHIDIKSLVSALKEGMVVWYAPDQHYAKKRSVTLPFFGQMTSFNSAIENIQQVTNCIVLTQFSRQLPTGEYEIAFGPPLTATLDNLITTQYVKCLESFILKAPEQYYWVHKRFK